MNEPINLDEQTNLIIDHILEISDMANNNPFPAYSREDIVAIGVKLFQLACMSELMNDPAVVVWHAATQSWFDKKAGGENG